MLNAWQRYWRSTRVLRNDNVIEDTTAGVEKEGVMGRTSIQQFSAYGIRDMQESSSPWMHLFRLWSRSFRLFVLAKHRSRFQGVRMGSRVHRIPYLRRIHKPVLFGKVHLFLYIRHLRYNCRLTSSIFGPTTSFRLTVRVLPSPPFQYQPV